MISSQGLFGSPIRHSFGALAPATQRHGNLNRVLANRVCAQMHLIPLQPDHSRPFELHEDPIHIQANQFAVPRF